MKIREQAYQAAKELCEIAGLTSGQIMIIGCSTSEVTGAKIGTNSDPGTAVELYEGIEAALKERGVYMAAQCCEHLNRAIVAERAAVPFAEEVNAVPQKKAGGSFATVAYSRMKDPVLLEKIRADAGLDIGHTLIGMHLKEVAVPVRLTISQIGEAPLVAARTRAKFIGGERAVYNESLK
ncbi:MAG: TIGR01440 family protein [Lachnospiraceae bacterium]|nr:TIGR01440 family protein [Lachnospiraceae bacterium]